MDLSRLRIEPRLRSSWEAVDLGIAMARTWYRPLLLCWLIPLIPLALVITLLLPERLSVALIAIWWFKPLLDRVPLYFASRALFGETLTVREVLRKVLTIWRFDWLRWLTWRRFNFTRSFDMPVTQLERLGGQARKQRLQVLHRQNTGAATWLTVIGIHLEGLLVFGVIALVSLLVPDEVNINFLDLALENTAVAEWLNHVLSILAMALIAPFYVMGGFALYLSRRIELEAWDVEIRFRDLAARRDQQPQRRGVGGAPGKGAVAAALLALCLWLPAPPVVAAETSSPPAPESIDNAGDARALVNAVLAGEDFHQKEQVRGWRLKRFEAEDGSDGTLPEWFITLVEWLEILFGLGTAEDEEPFELPSLALVIEIVLWCLAAALLGWVAYRYRTAIARFVGLVDKPRDEAGARPEVLFGLAVSRESLPEDIPGQVAALCERRDYRQALSLLYRATLSGLMHHKGFAFRDSHTEGECVAIVRRAGDERLSRFTEELTRTWQKLAYGHRLPPPSQIEQLCARWQGVFPSA